MAEIYRAAGFRQAINRKPCTLYPYKLPLQTSHRYLVRGLVLLKQVHILLGKGNRDPFRIEPSFDHLWKI